MLISGLMLLALGFFLFSPFQADLFTWTRGDPQRYLVGLGLIALGLNLLILALCARGLWARWRRWARRKLAQRRKR